MTVEEAAEDEIEELKKLLVIDPQKMIPAWRDPDKDPPKVETEVLVLYRCNGYLGITTAHYENGNVFSEDSEWNWEDLPIGEHTTRSGTTTDPGRLVGIPPLQPGRRLQ